MICIVSLSLAQDEDSFSICETSIEIPCLPYAIDSECWRHFAIPNSESEIWYRYRPRVDQFFSISTCTPISSDTTKFVDTEMWIYAYCDTLIPLSDGPEGAITYVDDGSCGVGADISAIELKFNELYFFRVRIKNAEDNLPIHFELDYSEEIPGCTDVNACNFDPYARIEDNSCYYNNCQPDLVIDKERLVSQLLLDSYTNHDPCLIEEGCLSGTGERDILRFTTLVENIGTADYIIGTSEDNPNSLSYNNCHGHLHALGYAEYLLFDEKGDPYPIGFKNGFCVSDWKCSEDKVQRFTCDYMGLSVGCFDEYAFTVDCQWIDLTDIPDGRYTFVVRVNWSRLQDLRGLEESNYDNNWAQVCLYLDRSSGELQVEIEEDCPTYTDCLGIEYGTTISDCNNDCGGSAHYGDINDDQGLDSVDLDMLYLDILDNDVLVSSCDDLFQDNRRSIYDLALLWQCLDSNLDTLSDHNHCDFPGGKLSELDTLEYELANLRYHSFDILAKSNNNNALQALEIEFENIHIDSIIFFQDIPDVDFKYRDNKLYLLAKDNLIQVSDTLSQLLKVYYSQEVRQIFCLQPSIESVNQNFDKPISTPLSPLCLDPSTVSTTSTITKNKVRVYPNILRNGDLTVESEAITNSRWEMHNTSGRLVDYGGFSSFDSIHKLSIDNLAPGLYFLTIIGDNWSTANRIVKL